MRTTDVLRPSGLLIAACASLLALAPGAAAQTMARPGHPPPPVAATADDPAKVAAAREFLVAFHPHGDPKYVGPMIDKMMPKMIEAAKQDNPKLDPKKFAQERKAELMARTTQMLDLQSHIVSRHFSLQELKGLSGFYRSPLGQKLTAEIPKIGGELMRQSRLRQPVPGMKVEVGPNGAMKPAPDSAMKSATSHK